MENKKHIVIFSHGFGVEKDSRGMFQGEQSISRMLSEYDVESVLFDYNQINKEENSITVTPISKQVEILREVIRKVKEENSGAVIDIIAHSQGCIAPALLAPQGIRKTILLAPSLDNDIERMVNYFKRYASTEIDFNGVSKLGRRDGSTTLVPSEHWQDRKNIEPKPLYNKFAQLTELTIIQAVQDDVLKGIDISDLDTSIKVLYLDGNHNFDNDAREGLIKTIREIIL